MSHIPVHKSVLEELIDMHIHTAPDVYPRRLNDIEAATLAKRAGMRAILIKSHHTLTADRAVLAENAVGGIRVFGGLALNAAVGGLNSVAVESALQMGAKVIWMPTISAQYFLSQKNVPGGITIFCEDGKFHSEVCEIVDLVYQYDAILATGHLSPKESIELVHYAWNQGLRRIMITHPEAAFVRMPIHIQTELASEGVFFERCFVNTTRVMGYAISIKEIIYAIREVGFESTVISTDFGQVENPLPVDGMGLYINALKSGGLNLHEIRRMADQNPSYLLGL